MILIVGLGNPGRKYQKTRHNLGFRVVDEFQKENNFPGFKLQKKSNVLLSKGETAGKKIILAKPQTFMNNSGQAVKAIFNFQFSIFNKSSINQFSNNNLIFIHDDIDLPLGAIRISKAHGSGGHKGVESVIEKLGTKDFTRVRIGIGENSKLKSQNSKPQLKSQKLEDFVLEKFSKEEEKLVKEIIKKTCRALNKVLTEGLEKAMAEFNV